MSPVQNLTTYLGAPVGDLLASSPFSGWSFLRSVEEDLPQKVIYYEFGGHGIDLACDDADRIQTIFLRHGDGEALAGIDFSLGRREVLGLLGVPSKSGSATWIQGLGTQGPWDRFTLPAACLHVQYRLDRDAIDRITMMRLGTEP